MESQEQEQKPNHMSIGEIEEMAIKWDTKLHKLKEFWNARHPDVKIITNVEKDIWKALKEHMANICESETCWLRQKTAGPCVVL